MSFSDLGLSEKVLAAVTEAGYTQPTPIQEQAIPHVMEGRDVVGVAQTGTGKTASFTLPMLTKLERGRARARMPRTLILEPTRELAAQVQQNFETYGVNHKLTVALLIGGVSFGEQDAKLTRGADVLIATPGRLLDHFGRGKLLLNGIDMLVIDEADRMLDMGFIPDIERILSLITKKHQTLLFSATMPPEIKKLADKFLTDPVRVEVAKPASTATTVDQKIVKAGNSPADKRAALRKLLTDAQDLQNAIIFCNRKRDIGTLQRSLQRHGFDAGALHGDMDQSARTATLDGFRAGTIPLLIASDVAARGLDVPEVSHVFNFDVPRHAEDYVHRIGRTGRAGRAGRSFTIATSEDARSVSDIEKLIGKSLDVIDMATASSGVEPTEDGERRVRGNRRGGRGRSRSDDAGDATPKAEAAKVDDRPKASKPAAEDGKPAKSDRSDHRNDNQGVRMQRASDSRSARDQDDRGQRSRGGRRDRYRDDEPAPLGFGDHVPAFMLRSALADVQAAAG